MICNRNENLITIVILTHKSVIMKLQMNMITVLVENAEERLTNEEKQIDEEKK